MIDTHCHLSYAPLFEHIDAVLDRARDVGVRHVIAIGTRLSDAIASRDLAARYPHVSCAVGVHPHHVVEEATDDEIAQVISMFTDPLVLAAGEMGLDFHYDFAPRARQIEVFERQLAAAKSAGKPLVLHSRESVDDSLAILKSAGLSRGVFHCFTGTMEEARRVLDAGFYLGFTGIITFKNTAYLREIVQVVPSDRLLLETDAPYLAPEPFRRQKNNEPALIIHTFRKAAELRSVTVDTIIEQTTANALRLFGLHLT